MLLFVILSYQIVGFDVIISGLAIITLILAFVEVRAGKTDQEEMVSRGLCMWLGTLTVYMISGICPWGEQAEFTAYFRRLAETNDYLRTRAMEILRQFWGCYGADIEACLRRAYQPFKQVTSWYESQVEARKGQELPVSIRVLKFYFDVFVWFIRCCIRWVIEWLRR